MEFGVVIRFKEELFADSEFRSDVSEIMAELSRTIQLPENINRNKYIVTNKAGADVGIARFYECKESLKKKSR